MNRDWIFWAGAMIAASPLLVAYFIAMIAALCQFRAFPRVALLVGGAFGFLLLISLVQMTIQPIITSLVFTNPNNRMSPEARQLTSAAIAAVFNILRAGASGVLCYAAFCGRSVRTPKWPEQAGSGAPGIVVGQVVR